MHVPVELFLLLFKGAVRQTLLHKDLIFLSSPKAVGKSFNHGYKMKHSRNQNGTPRPTAFFGEGEEYL